MRKSEVLVDESVAGLSQDLRHLHDIWEEIGIPKEQCLECTQVVHKHVKDLLEIMVVEEVSLKGRLLQSIVMLKQKQERWQELKALQERDQDLCDLLCAEPFAVTEEPRPVPSLAQLDAFRRHLAALTAEKERHWDEFLEMKQRIVLCMEELEQSPETSFEWYEVCEDEGVFCLSPENIAALKELLQQLEVKRSQKEALCEDLRFRILVLWNCLQVPAEEREAFTPYMVGFGSEIMNTVQQEEEHLEQLNIQNVVEAIRGELASYWEKCFYSEQQRRSFSPYFEDDITEELLQQHNAEILQIKQYYEAHQVFDRNMHII